MKISTKDPATMTNAQIVRESHKMADRSSTIAKTMIADGLGHIRPSDMRDNPNIHPLAREELAMMDRQRQLGIEASMRYGHGYVYIGQLLHQGKSYRRIKAA